MKDYMKRDYSNTGEFATDLFIAKIAKSGFKKPAKAVLASFLFVLALLSAGLIVSVSNFNRMDGTDEFVSIVNAPVAATSDKKGVISIPAGVVKTNPFLPYRNIGGASVTDVPQFDLVEPPEVLNEGSDAARVMDTIVSGILYDKHSPSAIINIEGNDYLVKKGDVVNNYKILDICKDSVTVRLGSNTYKAGIGEILTEGSVNYNEVSNLGKKFGGEKR